MTNRASLEVEFSVQVNQSQGNVSNQGFPLGGHSILSKQAVHLYVASTFPAYIYLPLVGELLLLICFQWRDGGWDTTEPGQGHLSSLLPQCSRQQVKTWGGHHQVLRLWSPTHTLTDHEQETPHKRC